MCLEIKNAIRYLKESKCEQNRGEEHQEQHNKVLDTAIDALEKQITRVAEETQEIGFITYICPICSNLNMKYNYCHYCGQKIDIGGF